MLLIAVTAGIICGVIVAAFFIALDRTLAAQAQTSGVWTAPPVNTPLTKRLENLARPLASRLPALAAGELRQKLSRAGDPGNLTPAGFQAVRYGLSALFAIAGLALGLLVHTGIPPLLTAVASGVVAAVLGYFLPLLWLNQRISGRRTQIQRSLAEATDLLRLGRPRMAALEHMADTCGVADLHHLVESIVQSDQMGVPIARLLRVQATEMRRRQRQTAQERAAQASSRMVFPMVGCIFPVLWIVLLGPAIIQILSTVH